MKQPDPLKEVRERHNRKFNTLLFGGDHHGLPSYFSGWGDISHLVSKAFGVKNVSRIENAKEAEEMAEELSIIFFKHFYKKG